MKINVVMTREEAFELTSCTKNLDNPYDRLSVVYPEAKNEFIARLEYESNDREMPSFNITVEIDGHEI